MSNDWRRCITAHNSITRVSTVKGTVTLEYKQGLPLNSSFVNLVLFQTKFGPGNFVPSPSMEMLPWTHTAAWAEQFLCLPSLVPTHVLWAWM